MASKNKKDILAQQRTDLAVQRTILANSRTFTAWLRTGLSLVLAGLAIAKFVGENQIFEEYALLIGIIFVLMGIAIYVLGLLSYKKSFDELKQTDKKTTISYNILIFITGGMILTGLLIIGLLLFY